MLKFNSTIVTCARESLETNYKGAITYLVDNRVYRAIFNATTNKIEIITIFTFASGSTSDFMDMFVHDKFAVVKLLS
jgi:hypothetical protein